MDTITALGEVFRDLWGFFELLKHPVLGISFGSILIGFFVVCFSVTLLRPLLGIGSGVIRSVTSTGRGIKSRHDANVRRRERERNAESRVSNKKNW